MISTIGEAHDLGWRISVACAFGKRDGMKSIRECVASVDLDLKTLVWTRGRDFPIDMLATRMKCIRCGSRRVRVLYSGPTNSSAARAVGR